MDCLPKSNTSPFLHDAGSVAECPTTCPREKLPAHHCYWDEALFDCFHDLSGHDNNHNHNNSNHPQDYASTSSYGFGSFSVTVSADSSRYDDEDDEEGYGGHAALHYADVEEAGPPARPQEFPTPFVHQGIRTMVRAMDHRTRKIRDVKNVLLAVAAPDNNNQQQRFPNSITERAYLLKKKIAKSSYGNRYLSVVLQRRTSISRTSSFERDENKRPEDDWNEVEWESTEQFVTVTVSPWNQAMRQHRRSLSCKRAGPVHAIAAMQHVGNYHPHVLGLVGVFEDEEHLYTVSRVHGDFVDLQTKIVSGRSQGAYVPNEAEARGIFHQLLQGLFHLQRKGVCHSNLSLENVYIDRATNQNLAIVDLARAIRVPYNDPSNYGCLAGESEGTPRRLLQLLPQDFASHPTENLMYLAPEILENEDAFDGFAADLFAAAVVLFVLLVGMAPFKTAHYWDAAYAEISSGNLHGLLASLNIQLSDEAIGLLQNMFWRDPRDRLTLAEILDHPWVKNQRFPANSKAKGNTIPRNTSNSHLSGGETASTSSSDKPDKARLTPKRKTISQVMSGFFTKEGKDSSGSGNPSKHRHSDSSSSIKGWAGLMNNSSRGSKARRASLGGLSSAASSATAGSPGSHKSISCDDEKEVYSGFQVLQLPKL
ncbi:activated protein kinase catalytic subunit alpha-1 [Seminavis robusta]|uniref:Activated protein kinase catalytic subunit alpha-1 n=1 Tax=Seminavis robusta TaxID=568900 RepID=A0A9N8EC69_9STRA|nr:activated protein kinase catalytic subunit alpha-1 [Seminavis robusta]|eukprot:Sro958_g224660.1 activated protein kinase catalytic subunit alpha-1 (652) ;mRNA; f:24159-26114